MVAYKHLVVDPVFECDRLLYLRVSARQAVVLRHLDGNPVRGFQGDWQPVAVYTGLGCLYLLVLEAHGTRASWILAPDGRRLGDKLSDLAPEQREALRNAALGLGLSRLPGLLGDGIQVIELGLLADILALVGGPSLRSGPGALPAAPVSTLALLQAPARLSTWLRWQPGASGLDLLDGWMASSDGGDPGGSCRAVGELSAAAGGIVPPAARYLLSLGVLPASADPCTVEIRLGGSPVGRFPLDPKWQSEGADLAFWIAPGRLAGRRFEIEFRHGGDFVLRRLSLDYAGEVGAHELSPRELMQHFENIGDNCEFGLVQRHFEAEPVGLLRFAGLRNPHRLIRFLEDDFGNFGEPGSLAVSVIGGEYWIVDHTYGVAYHTFRYQHEVGAEEVIRENEVKVGYLKRKLREDLEDAEKILVYKRVVTQDPHEILALHAALNRYGAVNRLLWVTEADETHAPGDVEWVGERLLKGYLARISLSNANEFDAGLWLTLCRNALATFEAAEAP